jgi:cyclophilin family peptidyl-prolyl cis-trans isomerase
VTALLRRCLFVLLVAAGTTLPAHAADEVPLVEIATTQGTFVLELWPEESPATVDNFLEYVDRGFYDGLVFHRVIPDFMIQAGGFDATLEYKDPFSTVVNESVGGPRNLRATVAMARQRNPNSADSQFFVNLKDNRHLDADGQRPGYTVFGRVVRGMDIVDRISMVRTGVRSRMRDVPLENIVIESVRRLD